MGVGDWARDREDHEDEAGEGGAVEERRGDSRRDLRSEGKGEILMILR